MSDAIDLPKGWAQARVDSLVQLVNGFAFKPTQWKSEGLPIIRIQNLNNPDAPFNYCPENLPDKIRVRNGDLLFAWSGTPGTSFGAHIWRGEDAWLNQHIFKVNFNREYLDERFLRLAINQNLDGYIRQAHGGAGLAHITKGRFEESKLSIAPLNEQRRIVAKIEELFSDLDAGEAALKRAKANLKRYRAAVLKAAVEGRLTEEWRSKHPAKEPASALLARILKERRQKWEADQLAKFAAANKEPPKNWREKYVEPSPPDVSGLPSIPKSWTWATLDAMANIVGGVTKDQKKANQPGMREVLYLRVANVQRGFLDLSEMKTISASEDDIAELRLEPGDVLFNEGGDRDKLGRGWVWSGELSECIHQNHVFRGRLVSQEIHPRFVSHHGNTFGKEWFIKAGKQTTNLASINLGVLRRFPVPIPPAEEQAEIISQVDEILSQIDATEKQIEHGLLRASRLRQSILNEAFSGRLVPQDPKDESASRLLERIRVEKALRSNSETPSRGTKMKSHSRRPIIDVLNEHPKGIAPEELLSKAGFGITDVDAFYSELRSISSQIEEQRPEEPKINKWPKGAKILLRAKKA